jgi:hypothetical protein
MVDDVSVPRRLIGRGGIRDLANILPFTIDAADVSDFNSAADARVAAGVAGPVSRLSKLEAAGWRFPQMYSDVVMANGSADDSAWLAAWAADARTLGGKYRLPAGDWMTNSTDILLGGTGLRVEGDGRQRTYIRGGGGVRFDETQGFYLGGFSVVGALTHGVSVSMDLIAGGSASGAWSEVRDIHVQGATNKGFEFGDCFMMNAVGLHAQGCGGIGIDASLGFKTTFHGRTWHVTDAGGIGIKIGFAVASRFFNIASDRAGDYGVLLRDLEDVQVFAYGEYNTNALFGLYYDGSWADARAKGFKSVTIGGWDFNSDQSGTTAPFAHFTASSPQAQAGDVRIEGARQHVASVAEPIWVQTGSWDVIDGGGNASDLLRIKGGAYSSVRRRGSVGGNLSVTVAAAPAATPICTIGPALRNGTSTFEGKFSIAARKNARTVGSRGALYEFRFVKVVGDSGTVTLTPDHTAGDWAGSATDSASFTFSYDHSTNQLSVIPAGLNTGGGFYFEFEPSLNLSVVPV